MRFSAEGMLGARTFMGRGWSLERHRSSGCRLNLPYRRFHVLSFYPEGRIEMRRTGRYGSASQAVERGDLGLSPAWESESMEWRGERVAALYIHISPARIEEASPFGFGGVRRRLRFRDRVVSAHAGAIYDLSRRRPAADEEAAAHVDAIIARLGERYAAPLRTPDTVLGVAVPDLLDAVHGRPATRNSVGALAKTAGVSPTHFHRVFRALTGSSPHDMLIRSRVEVGKHYIQKGEFSFAEIALKCGFSDQSHFTNAFSKRVGLSPGAFADWFGAG
jgi:AraC-like DNA-binding protein